MTTAAQLTRASRRVRDAVTVRDQLVRQMRDEGATLRQIAAAASLSAAGVKKIVDRQEEVA